jgi:hypothetical protein
MPTVYEVNTGIRFSPATQLPALFLSPSLEFETAGVGFRLTDASAARQQRTISECIRLVKEQQIQLVVMPECSMPRTFFQQLDTEIRGGTWPNNSIVITGVEPVSMADLSSLLAQSNNPEESKIVIAGTSTFANICSVWIKNDQGEVRNFIQLKQRPSKEEQAIQGLYQGDFILLFRTDVLSLAVLICIDCIGIGIDQLVAAMTAGIPDGMSRDLNALFVIQHNDQPEHTEFISFAEKLLSIRPKLRTDQVSSVAFVNSASPEHGRAPQENYGRSAIYYFRRGNWQGCSEDGPLELVPHTFAFEKRLNTLVRVRFREDGPSVNKFTFIIPSSVGPASGEPKYPLNNAVSLKLNQAGALGPFLSVPPLKKVISDWICTTPPLGDGRFSSNNGSLAPRIVASYDHVRRKLEAVTAERVEQLVNLLMLGFRDGARPAHLNPDSWQKLPSDWYADTHGQALLELASVATALEFGKGVEFHSSDHTNCGEVGNYLFTIIDGHNDIDHERMTESYFRWLRHSPWGQTLGKTTLIYFTRSATYPSHDRPTEVPFSFCQLTTEEVQSLPERVAPNPDSILETPNRFYLISGPALRSAMLLANSATEAENRLRRLIEIEA